MLDRLPPSLRHLLILLVIAPATLALGLVATAVITAGGVLGVDWPATGRLALDASAVSAASGVTALIALYVTPLTRTYGLGKDTRDA